MKIAHLAPLAIFCGGFATGAKADPPFVPGPEFYAGVTPWACIVGDIDGDGVLDLAVANYSTPGYATILLGDGAAGFLVVSQPPVDKAPNGLASGDFNSDGKLDLVVSSISNDSTDIVSVMLGNGNGTFAPPVEYGVGGFPRFVKVADLNNDRKPDIILVSSNGNAVSVLLGIGDGTFSARTDYPLNLSPMNILAKDIDGDGVVDAVVAANSLDSAFVILQGVGDGTFLPPAYFGTGGPYISVAAEDFNRDGHTDVALLNRVESKIDVFLADSAGEYGVSVSLPTDSNVGSIAAGDLYGDGRIEIVSAGYSGVRIFDAHGDGTFQDMGAIQGAFGGYDAVIADINGDGALDIFSPDASRFTSHALLNQTVFRSGFD